ncbi:hypothetical protein AOLI_G00027100 [Acnodon oligacanthus]
MCLGQSCVPGQRKTIVTADHMWVTSDRHSLCYNHRQFPAFGENYSSSLMEEMSEVLTSLLDQSDHHGASC